MHSIVLVFKNYYWCQYVSVVLGCQLDVEVQ